MTGLSLTGAGCGAAPSSVPAANVQSITRTTQDGVELTIDLYRPDPSPPPGTKSPGLVLVHMLGKDRATWQNFAQRASHEGYYCAALDLRGHGGSRLKNSQRITYRSFSREDWLAATEDINTALTLLLENKVDPDNLAIAGASIGANLALRFAAKEPRIQALILLSPGLEYHGVETLDALADFGKRPLLLMTSREDEYSASSCTTLKNAAATFCELREYEGAAHGTAMLDTDPDAAAQILLWLRPIIGPGHTPKAAPAP